MMCDVGEGELYLIRQGLGHFSLLSLSLSLLSLLSLSTISLYILSVYISL